MQQTPTHVTGYLAARLFRESVIRANDVDTWIDDANHVTWWKRPQNHMSKTWDEYFIVKLPTLHSLWRKEAEALKEVKGWINIADLTPTVAPARPSDPKETNPKAAIGVRKVSLSVVPMDVVLEASLGMLEGAAKYGKANYLASGARASVYYDGTMRHLNQWWLGENIDADSGLHHISKAISSLMVLRSCMLAEKFTDDRPPLIGFDMHQLNDVAACILEKHKDKNPRHYTIQDEV